MFAFKSPILKISLTFLFSSPGMNKRGATKMVIFYDYKKITKKLSKKPCQGSMFSSFSTDLYGNTADKTKENIIDF